MSYRDQRLPDETMPAGTNLFGTIDASVARGDVGRLFRAAGWTIRESGFGELTIESSFAELVLDGDQPLLLHGPVADVLINARRIANILREGQFSFSLECYSDGGELLATLRHDDGAA